MIRRSKTDLQISCGRHSLENNRLIQLLHLVSPYLAPHCVQQHLGPALGHLCNSSFVLETVVRGRSSAVDHTHCIGRGRIVTHGTSHSNNLTCASKAWHLACSLFALLILPLSIDTDVDRPERHSRSSLITIFTGDHSLKRESRAFHPFLTKIPS